MYFCIIIYPYIYIYVTTYTYTHLCSCIVMQTYSHKYNSSNKLVAEFAILTLYINPDGPCLHVLMQHEAN